VVHAVRVIAGLACLAVLVLAPSAGAAQPVHYATALKGTDAFIGIAKTGKCFKAYLSDGTGVATLSVWFQGCVQSEGDRLSAERGGVRIDAAVDRRRASGTITLRDGRALPFSAKGGFGGGIVGRRFKYDGRRYRSGWVVLGENQVRWAITPIGHGLYGDSPPPRRRTHAPPRTASATCSAGSADCCSANRASGSCGSTTAAGRQPLPTTVLTRPSPPSTSASGRSSSSCTAARSCLDSPWLEV
jgi:hypothetical protein